MKDKIHKIVLSLSANEVSGSYTIREESWEISKETEGMVYVAKKYGPERLPRASLGVVKETHTNPTLSSIGVSVQCYGIDVPRFTKDLEEALTFMIQRIAKININAVTAFEGGHKIYNHE